MKPHSTLSLLLALGFSSSAMAQTTTVVYQDDFDDEDINSNSNGIGGNLTYYNRQGGAMQESAAGLVPTRNNNNDRGNAISTNSFSLVGGFQLTVEFTVADTGVDSGGTAWRSQIALSASENVVLADQNNTTYAQSFLFGSNSNTYRGLGIITNHSSASIIPGLYSASGLAGEILADRLADSAQVIPIDEPTVLILTVNPDQTYTYSINEETASVGTLAIPFDFSKTYHFQLYDQDTEFVTSLQSVTLEVFDTPELGIPVIATDDTLVEVGDPVTFDITFDPTAETATLDVPGEVDLDLLALDTDGDGVVQITETATTTHLYELSLTKTGVNDANTSIEVVVLDPASQAADNAFSTAIKTDSPLFYYRFEEASDSPALLDSSGNGNHVDDLLNITLGATPVPGGMGNSSAWTENGYIFVPATSDLTQSFTFMTMLNLDDFSTLGSRRDILSMAQGTGIAGGALLSYSSEGLLTTIGGGINVLADPTQFSSGGSCLLHFVYDSDPDDNIETVGGEVRLYLNGVLAGTHVATTGANIGNWILASSQNLGNNSPRGWMDESAIFGSELTEAQITAHNTAFFTAADPFLGFRANAVEINFGEPFVLEWKVSDAATAVTINGSAVDGADAGGAYTASFSPTTDTTYTIEVTGPDGPFTQTVNVTVVGGPPAQPKIISISTDGATPPNITLEITGEPNTTYLVQASADLNDGFPFEMTDSALTDDSGQLSITFPTVSQVRFFRLETPPVETP